MSPNDIMDLLVVTREGANLPATPREVTEPAEVQALIKRMTHGAQLSELLSRLSVGVLVLTAGLDRTAARSSMGVAIQRSKPRGALLIGYELGAQLFGSGLPPTGGVREMHSISVGVIGRAKPPEIEQQVADICQRAHLPWAPPSARARAAQTVLRAEQAEVLAARLIEQQQWGEAVEILRAAEPLAPRGTNMLGRALLQMGDREAARRAFERTLASDPGNSIAQRQLGTLGG